MKNGKEVQVIYADEAALLPPKKTVRQSVKSHILDLQQSLQTADVIINNPKQPQGLKDFTAQLAVINSMRIEEGLKFLKR